MSNFLLLIILILAVSCKASPSAADVQNAEAQPVQQMPQTPDAVQQPETVREPETVRQPETIQQPETVPVAVEPVEAVFDPGSVTREQYESDREEVRRFIEELNQIIRNRNYNAWRAALSDEYFREISSPANLQQISEQPAMRTRRIVLRTAEDYFFNVVVPSRANSRVDDITYIGENRVQAFTFITNRAGEAQRLRLYDLEKIGNSWKIIN